MKFDERHLVQIAAVVTYGGASDAAKKLGISQPAISRTIAQMEHRLGEPLFVKGRRPLTPTPLGEIVARHGMAILTASRKASEAVASYRLGDLGVVRLGGVPFFLDALISRSIGKFQTHHPDIRVEQSYGHLSDLSVDVESQVIDFAITPMGLGEPPDGFSFTPLLKAHNVVAARCGHPLVQSRRLTATDVASYPWVGPLPGSPLLLDLHSILLNLGVSELAIRYTGGSLLSVVNYLADSDALAILPHSVVFSMRHENWIEVVPLDIPQPTRLIGILASTAAPMSAASSRLADHIAAEFASLSKVIERHERSLVWG